MPQWSFYYHPIIIIVFLKISWKKFFQNFISYRIATIYVGRVHCHTQGLSAGFALIAVNMVRSTCVDGVCHKVYQSTHFLHPIIMFAIIFKMFKIENMFANTQFCAPCVPIQVYISFMYLVILVCTCIRLGVTNCSMRALEVKWIKWFLHRFLCA